MVAIIYLGAELQRHISAFLLRAALAVARCAGMRHRPS